MTLYIDSFCKTRFTTTSSPEYFDENFQETKGNGCLNKVDPILLQDIYNQIVNLSLKKLPEAFKNEKTIRLVKVQKVFLFNDPEGIFRSLWLNSSYSVEQDNKGYPVKLFYGMWIFSLSNDKSLAPKYNLQLNRILVEPLYLSHDSSSNSFLPFDTQELEMKALLKYKNDGLCICNLTNDSYSVCCKYSLFFRPNRFGMFEMNSLKFLQDHLSKGNVPSIFEPAKGQLSYGEELHIAIKQKKSLHDILEFFFHIPITYRSQLTPDILDQLSSMSIDIDDNFAKIGYDRPLWVVKDKRGLVTKAGYSRDSKIQQLKDSRTMFNLERGLKEVVQLLELVVKHYPNFMTSFKAEISTWQELSKTNRKFLLLAMKQAQQKEYGAGSYLLFPQIEGCLRFLADTKKIPTYKTTDTFALTNKLLTALINDVFPKSEEHNSLAINQLLLRCLTNEGAHSLNLRNELLHDLDVEEHSKYEFYIGLYTLLLIVFTYKEYRSGFDSQIRESLHLLSAQQDSNLHVSS